MVVLINKKKFLGIMILFLAIGALFTFGNYTMKAFNNTQQPYTKGNKEQSGHVAITCNVDWGNEYLEDLFKTLKEENIKITFMVTGRWASKNPDLVLRIKEEGHEIGNHGYTHLDYSKLDYDSNYKEIKQAKDKIEDIIKEKTCFFEPPSGYYNDHTVKAAMDLNYIPIKWDIDTIDWKYKDDKEEIIRRIKSKKMEDGSIILMHPTKATTESLKTILNIIRENGYKPGRLNDIFKVE